MWTGNAKAEAFKSWIALTPDLSQETLQGIDWKVLCAPVAVSNSLVRLGRSGHPDLLPKGKNLRESQKTLVRTLASDAYMGTLTGGGTGLFRQIDGLSKYLTHHKKLHQITYAGWRPDAPAHFSGIKRPTLPWIRGKLRQGSGAWLKIGWYRKQANGDLARFGGHTVTLVGYDGDRLLAFDPAYWAGTDRKLSKIRLAPLAGGRLVGKYAGLPTDGVGMYRIVDGIDMSPRADVGLIDAVVFMTLDKP